MTDITTVIDDLKHEEEQERALAQLATLDDRLSLHRKRLWAISQSSGSEGVKSYKDKFPEARSIKVSTTTVTYQGKPAGYDDYLASLATKWLTNSEAASATNSMDIAALNSRFSTSRFNPANHFSKPLAKGSVAKIRAAFSALGVPLDISTIKTMSDIRKAAKAAQAASAAGKKPFGKIGTISGNELVCGGRVFPVIQHNGHDNIKVAVGGTRSWLRLDVLAAFAEQSGLVAGLGRGERETFSNYIPIEYIGDLVPDAESPDLDPLAAVEIGDLVPASNIGDNLLIGDLVPPTAEPSMSDRIATAKAQLSNPPAHSPAQPSDSDADPLAF